MFHQVEEILILRGVAPLPKSILLSIKLLDACSVVPAALGNAFESLTFCNVARHKRVYIVYGSINSKRVFYRFGLPLAIEDRSKQHNS